MRRGVKRMPVPLRLATAGLAMTFVDIPAGSPATAPWSTCAAGTPVTVATLVRAEAARMHHTLRNTLVVEVE